MFDPYLARWRLDPDGEPIVTHSSRLPPERSRGAPAMLKVAMEAEEQRGSALMIWWDGDGAARVLARDGNALLLERSTGAQSLTEMATCGNDDEASRILCAVRGKTARAARFTAAAACPVAQMVRGPCAGGADPWRSSAPCIEDGA